MLTYAQYAPRAPRALLDIASRTANALGHATTVLTHPAFGVVVASRDPNNVLTTRQVNDRGMVTRVKRAGAVTLNIGYSDRSSNGIKVHVTSSADSSISITEYDLRGRRIESRRSGFDGTDVYTKSVYDKLGREITWTLPAYGQPSSSHGSRTFDSLGRITSLTPPGGFATTYEHTFLTTEITTPGNDDAPKTKTRVTHDLDGRVASSEQYDAEADEWLETRYLYTDFDLIGRIIDPEGYTTTFSYDKLGRRTSLDEPDAGESSVEYDGLGNITRRVLGGSVTEYTKRDALGRLWEQVNDDGITTFSWDTKPYGIGKVAQSVSPDNIVHDFTYDVHGRPKSESWTIDGQAYMFVNAYDLHGRLKSRSYPAAGATQVEIKDHYNAFGYLGYIDGTNPITQTNTTFWRTYAVAATGGITHGLFGNGVTAERSYDPDSGRLDWIKDVGVLYQSFTYDVAGRVESQEEGSGRREEFTYDSLARLKTWTVLPKGHTDETMYAAGGGVAFAGGGAAFGGTALGWLSGLTLTAVGGRQVIFGLSEGNDGDVAEGLFIGVSGWGMVGEGVGSGPRAPGGPRAPSAMSRVVRGVTVTVRGGPAMTGDVDVGPTLDRIRLGGTFPHRNDGTIFQNRPLLGKTVPELPVQPVGYYQEYVHPTAGVAGPGPQRIVVGLGGETYYTPDHYHTFIRLY